MSAVAILAAVCSRARPALAEALPDVRRPADRVPVILVHGAFSTPDHCWGSADDPRGFYSFLTGRGYEPGTTLFRLDYSDDPAGDYAALYRRLDGLVTLAKARSGNAVVDMVTHSSGSLLARYYANNGGRGGGIRNLVMVSPPNNGSFLATSLRTAIAQATHEALRFNAPRPPAEPASSKVKVPTAFPEFRDETDYVAARAASVYEPLYGEFLLDTRVLGAPGGAGRGRFEDWIAREKADLYAMCFTRAVEPPLRPDWDMGDAPRNGKDLARAYYEKLALDVGTHNYIRFRGTGGTLSDTVLRMPASPANDVRDLVREYALRLVAYYAARLADVAITRAKETAVRLLESKTGLGMEADALRRLVSRSMTVARSAPPVTTNHFLHRWSEAEAAVRAADMRPARYVTVTGAALLPSLASAAQPGENDGAVEVVSACLPQCADDVLKVFRGVVWPHHGGLLRSPEVHRFILRQLERYYPVKAAHAPSFRSGWLKWWTWSETGRVEASPWEPCYVQVDSTSVNGRPGVLTVKTAVEGIPAGAAFRAWLDRFSPDGAWLGRDDIAPGSAGAATVHSFGGEVGRVLVGFRLTAECGSDRDLRRLERVSAAVRYSLAFEAAGEASGSGAGADPAGDGAGTAATDGAGPTGVVGDVDAGEPVTINVIRSSRQTVPGSSLTGEHVAWEWEFGDGNAMTDTGSGRTSSVTHVFERPGEYTVTARSRDSRGNVLREEVWDVAVDREAFHDTPPASWEFTAGGPDPEVKVEVSGPLVWVTGRPATYRVSVDASRMETGSGEIRSRQVISVEPGREFQVVWQRPGVFEVRAAARVRLTYDRPGGRVSIMRTYTGTVSVRVNATSVTG